MALPWEAGSTRRGADLRRLKLGGPGVEAVGLWERPPAKPLTSLATMTFSAISALNVFWDLSGLEFGGPGVERVCAMRTHGLATILLSFSK